MTESTDRHDTCKFGEKDNFAVKIYRECTNEHCNTLIGKNQCITCGYYDKKYPGWEKC